MLALPHVLHQSHYHVEFFLHLAFSLESSSVVRIQRTFRSNLGLPFSSPFHKGLLHHRYTPILAQDQPGIDIGRSNIFCYPTLSQLSTNIARIATDFLENWEELSPQLELTSQQEAEIRNTLIIQRPETRSSANEGDAARCVPSLYHCSDSQVQHGALRPFSQHGGFGRGKQGRNPQPISECSSRNSGSVEVSYILWNSIMLRVQRK